MENNISGELMTYFYKTKSAIACLISRYNSIDDLLSDFPDYPLWLQAAIRWSEKLQWETELDLQFELYQISDNLLFAYIVNKRFNAE